MLFWIICGAIAFCVTGLLALSIWQSGRSGTPAAEFDLQVYRDQLAEVDRDQARGVLGEEDAEHARNEIARRILAADKALREAKEGTARASSTAAMGMTAVISAALIGGSLYLYDDLGAPGYGDLPLQMRIEMSEIARAERPTQEQAEATLPAFVPSPDLDPDYVALVEKLRAAVESRPGDLEGAQLLARHEMSLGNASAAYKAQSQVIRLKGNAATAQDFAGYADMLVIAAGGYVSPEAEGALAAALRLDPRNGVARYYSGLLASQIGRPDLSFRTWASLLNDSRPTEPWVPAVRDQIEDMAFRAGVDYALAPLPEPRGPDADDVKAASEMSEDERMEMIRGMVGNLSDRLATEGGPVEDWARLISSLVVLGDGDGALLVYADAKDVFAKDPNAMRLLLQTARRVGMPE